MHMVIRYLSPAYPPQVYPLGGLHTEAYMLIPVREWLANELRVSGRTTLDFFHECWVGIYRTPCRSNTVSLDVEHYRRLELVPVYVCSTYERLAESLSAIKLRGLSENMHRPGHDLHCRLVAEPSILLMARKGRDGVYRC